mgnify:CR=1 FL=1
MAGKKASKAASTDGVDAAPAGAKSGGVVGLALLAVGALATSFATVYFLTPSGYSRHDRKRTCDALHQIEDRDHLRLGQHVHRDRCRTGAD